MSDIYVKFADIPGESTNAAYADQIYCVSMRHAISHEVLSTGARKVGTSRHGAIEFTHAIDKATPKLHQAVASGSKCQGEVTITRMRSEGVAEEITLYNVYVVRVDVDTPLDGDTMLPDKEEPLETFALEYSKIKWDYKWYEDDEAKGSATGGWDTQTLEKV